MPPNNPSSTGENQSANRFIHDLADDLCIAYEPIFRREVWNILETAETEGELDEINNIWDQHTTATASDLTASDSDAMPRRKKDDMDTDTETDSKKFTHNGSKPTAKAAKEAAGDYNQNPVELLPGKFAIKLEYFDSYEPAYPPPSHPRFEGLSAPTMPCGKLKSATYQYDAACNVYLRTSGDPVFLRPVSRKPLFEIVTQSGTTVAKKDYSLSKKFTKESELKKAALRLMEKACAELAERKAVYANACLEYICERRLWEAQTAIDISDRGKDLEVFHDPTITQREVLSLMGWAKETNDALRMEESPQWWVIAEELGPLHVPIVTPTDIIREGWIRFAVDARIAKYRGLMPDLQRDIRAAVHREEQEERRIEAEIQERESKKTRVTQDPETDVDISDLFDVDTPLLPQNRGLFYYWCCSRHKNWAQKGLFVPKNLTAVFKVPAKDAIGAYDAFSSTNWARGLRGLIEENCVINFDKDWGLPEKKLREYLEEKTQQLINPDAYYTKEMGAALTKVEEWFIARSRTNASTLDLRNKYIDQWPLTRTVGNILDNAIASYCASLQVSYQLGDPSRFPADP
ncbi:hypothetical protein BDV34DRAFT_222698 [Aspergillus parasiticus]|uniref:Uncharacterized protein n=1 Tax=Aspergillus parasiticus TaxID=5067 RepID=A0A5N6DSW4_ASPPA|nr:hypothetical protein BDV34DRAFT_222698 [Aspergillus parasiticus]